MVPRDMTFGQMVDPLKAVIELTSLAKKSQGVNRVAGEFVGSQHQRNCRELKHRFYAAIICTGQRLDGVILVGVVGNAHPIDPVDSWQLGSHQLEHRLARSLGVVGMDKAQTRCPDEAFP